MKQRLFSFLKSQDQLCNESSYGALMNAMQNSVELFNKNNGTNYAPFDVAKEFLKLN